MNRLTIFYLSLLLTLISFASCDVIAQEKLDLASYQPKLFFSQFELLSGPSLSFLKGNTEVDYVNGFEKLKAGFTLGIGTSHLLAKKFELNVKLLFERRGGLGVNPVTYYDTSTQTMKEGKVERRYSYDYISAPITMNYLVGRKDNFNVGLGLFISYLKKQTVKEHAIPIGGTFLRDETELNKKMDFGLALKIEYLIPVSKNLNVSVQLINVRGLYNTRLNTYPGQAMYSNSTSLVVCLIKKNFNKTKF